MHLCGALWKGEGLVRDKGEAAAHSVQYSLWFKGSQSLAHPTPLLAEWSLIGVRIKEKLLSPPDISF